MKDQGVPQPLAPYEGPPPYTATVPPSYSAPTYPPSSSYLLHVYHSGVINRKIEIRGPDKATVLYTVNLNSGSLFSPKPHMTVWKASTGTVIGTATFHSFSRDVDMVINNYTITLSASGIFTTAHEWTSLAATTGGERTRFKWKMGGFLHNADMTCLDQQDQVCARFESSAWALKKNGKFDIAPSVSGVLLDEIIVVGLVMLELKKRRDNANAAAGAAA
ncbi:hypothetical protein BDR22DRAFT_305728 [Usnea florida]